MENIGILVNSISVDLVQAGEPFALRQDSILEGFVSYSPTIRQIPGFRHHNLKKVIITRFSSAKSLIELTCQILEGSSSLEHLVLDTTDGFNLPGKCGHMVKIAVMEGLKGVMAIRRYVKGKVPSSVKLEVLKPCRRCHIPELDEAQQSELVSIHRKELADQGSKPGSHI